MTRPTCSSGVSVAAILLTAIFSVLMSTCLGNNIYDVAPAKGDHSGQESHHRVRRFILTNNSQLRISPEIRVPIQTGTAAVTSYWEIAFPITFTIRTPFARSSDSDQLDLFMFIENTLQRFGVNGRACLLRAICEVAEIPTHNNGLLGNVIDHVLRLKQKNKEKSEAYEYKKAENFGRSHGSCWSAYSSCPISIFKMIPF
ncbi:hypothetical protein GQR58_002004 [Nymphon striatum]|nr:hypothetical protein GQR58_002004 [Nymphon striatum]